MKLRIFPYDMGFKLLPVDYVDPDVSPLMTYLWSFFVVTLFLGVSTAYPAVQRYNAEHPTYATCTLERSSVSRIEYKPQEHHTKVVFKTSDCGIFTYEGFDYALPPEQLEKELQGYTGQDIIFRDKALKLLPSKNHKTDQFAVGDLDFRTWDIRQLK